jgi:site-specific DNA recombinase
VNGWNYSAVRKTFGVGTIYKILTNTTYMGEWKFNRMSSRTGKWKPDEEVVTSKVPAIIAASPV